MNTIPKNYQSKLTLRETQEAQLLIKNELVKQLNEKLEFFIIREPKISSERISTNNNEGDIKRPINFDSSNDSIIYFIYNKYRYWFTNSLKKLEVKNNNGIASFINHLNRDEEITNIKSLEKNTFQLEYRFDNKELALEKSLELTRTLLSIIRQIENKVVKQYPSLSKTIPETIVEKEYSKIGNVSSTNSVIDDIASDYGNFVLINKRKNKSQQSFSNNFEIKFFGYSKEINEAFEVFHFHDRKTIEDLEPLSSESKSAMEEYLFAKETLNNEDIRSINLTIDLDTLSMILLEKCHILELQSGKNLEEIEKILISSDIKHL